MLKVTLLVGASLARKKVSGLSVLAHHLYSVLGAGGIAALLMLRAFLKLARMLVIAALAVAVVAAVHAGVLP
jgi:hypothetical protein